MVWQFCSILLLSSCVHFFCSVFSFYSMPSETRWVDRHGGSHLYFQDVGIWGRETIMSSGLCNTEWDLVSENKNKVLEWLNGFCISYLSSVAQTKDMLKAIWGRKDLFGIRVTPFIKAEAPGLCIPSQGDKDEWWCPASCPLSHVLARPMAWGCSQLGLGFSPQLT